MWPSLWFYYTVEYLLYFLLMILGVCMFCSMCSSRLLYWYLIYFFFWERYLIYLQSSFFCSWSVFHQTIYARNRMRRFLRLTRIHLRGGLSNFAHFHWKPSQYLTPSKMVAKLAPSHCFCRCVTYPGCSVRKWRYLTCLLWHIFFDKERFIT
jgi:hypothetical protein